MFLSKEAGDILAFESNDRNKTFIFKILQFEDIELLRVQYIYFNNNEIDIHRIDSLRQLILNKLNGGESFDNLAKMYSMDGNAKNGGDLGWFEEGMMMNEFEDAIRKNDFGEIFKVDIPSEKWYYIVKNSYKPLRGKRVTAICVEVSN
ncbi:MAG: peptidylprolyl isomerase [Cyclobacteriaceae bacterium]|nr:peptidylprolyl isomerase [Cyclobacteriaceae bacterium]